MEIDAADSSPPPAAAAANSSSSVARIVFPGDKISVMGTGVRLGNGLVQASLVAAPGAAAASAGAAAAAASSTPATSAPHGDVVVTKCGLLRKGAGGSLWVDNTQKRYHAAVDDLVVGVVIEAHAEAYRVDIGASQPALLPALAFEGATKRNKPNLPLGALVYARVVVCARDVEVELSCTSPHFKKEWVTGQSLYGELLGGYALNCSTGLARQLMNEDDAYVLACLGKFVPFELAIGVNGRVWINAATPLHTILVTNGILNSEGRSKEHITAMVQKIMQAL
jgi:exosome complex component RRP40